MCHTHHAKNYSMNGAIEKVRQYLQTMMIEMGIIDEQVTEAECESLLKELNKVKKLLEATYRRGGLTVITVRETLITAYRFDSFNVRTHVPSRFCQYISYEERGYLKKIDFQLGIGG